VKNGSEEKKQKNHGGSEQKHDKKLDTEKKNDDIHSKIKEMTKKYDKYGQKHVFQFIDSLNDQQKDLFIQDLQKIDLDHVTKHFNLIAKHDEEKKRRKDFAI